ncbi:MAG: hypothetical protein KF729_34870 [Sandaracinaceae bacterium]|nr:hypothetical protein [Sandaracinaceae bacterium]
MLTPRTWLLLAWIVVGASVLVAHVNVVWQVLSTKRPKDGGRRWLALVPPMALFYAAQDRRWGSLVVWVGALALYVVLRLAEW